MTLALDTRFARPLPTAFAQPLRQAWQRFLAERRARQALARLGDHLLRDIGLERDDIAAAARAAAARAVDRALR